jgi:hypothetical protein
MDAAPQNPAVSYRIRREAAGWAVDRGPVRLGAFADAEAAVAEACRSAKADALRGRLAIVTAETVPQELHSYVPDRSAPIKDSRPDAAIPPNRLRLVVSR